jgi:hypothetical protein
MGPKGLSLSSLADVEARDVKPKRVTHAPPQNTKEAPAAAAGVNCAHSSGHDTAPAQPGPLW